MIISINIIMIIMKTIRITEHQKSDSPVGQHVAECCGQSKAFEWRLNDKSNDVEKLLTLEALQKSKRKPHVNSRGEYRSRKLTKKYYSDTRHVRLIRIFFFELKHTD